MFTVFALLCLFCICDFITLQCHISMKHNLFCRKNIKQDFLHGRKNFAKELPDKHCALFQSFPKLNRMLITRLISIQRKSSRFLSPVSTVSARNAWDHGRPFGEDQPKKTPALLESHYAKASLTNKGLDWMVNLKTILCQGLTPSSSFSIIYCFSFWLTKEQQQKYLSHEVLKSIRLTFAGLQ